MSRYVPEGPPNGPRHGAKQLVSVGSAISAKERSAPAINRGMRRQRLDKPFEASRMFRRVGKRIGAGKIFYIGCAKVGRRMIETNTADNVKLAGPVAKMSGRHVIAEAIPRPGKLPGPGSDFEFRFNYPLIVVVAWTQHHPVLAERNRLFVVICRNVSNSENRHCRPMIYASDMHCERNHLHSRHFSCQILYMLFRNREG